MYNWRIIDTSSEADIQSIWEKATIVSNYDENLYRKDAAGAWIARNAYGDRDSVFGWEIEHIFPQSLGGKNHYGNLRPMHWRNNLSKGDDYPIYEAVVVAEGNHNITKSITCTVNKNIQRIIKEFNYHVN